MAGVPVARPRPSCSKAEESLITRAGSGQGRTDEKGGEQSQRHGNRPVSIVGGYDRRRRIRAKRTFPTVRRPNRGSCGGSSSWTTSYWIRTWFGRRQYWVLAVEFTVPGSVGHHPVERRAMQAHAGCRRHWRAGDGCAELVVPQAEEG